MDKIKNLDLRKAAPPKGRGKQSLITSETYKGGFEGGANTKRWYFSPAPETGPNIGTGKLSILRRRSRELIRNSPYISGAVDSFVSNFVGSGITPRWDTPETQAVWDNWVASADYSGICDFYGQQEVIARAVFGSGECLVRLIKFADNPGNVPLQLQLLEGDLLDESYTIPSTKGNSIKYGIEVSEDGKRIAYYVRRGHPSEPNAANVDMVRIPADEILLVYDIQRPGQLRGLPWTHTVLTRINEINQARNAELVRRKTTAMFGGFIKTPPDDSLSTNMLGEKVDSDDSSEIIALEPGEFPRLPAGMDVVLSTPSDVSGSYIDWMRDCVREVAKGMRITFEQLTGDLTQVNFSSIRAGAVEFRRLCRVLQNKIMIHQVCRPISKVWYETAILTGFVVDPDYKSGGRVPVSWHPQPWQYVKPSEDVRAEIEAVKAGFKSRSDVVAERGGDARALDSNVVEDNERSKSNKVRYSTDVYLEDAPDD